MLALWSLLGSLGRRALAAEAVLLGVLLLIPAGGPSARPPEAPHPSEAERLVFLLQYIAVDYGAAVQDGAIVNPFEYQEMRKFSQLLVDRFPELQARGASEQIRSGFVKLQEQIRAMRPWTEVRALANDLTGKLGSELEGIALPAVAPDVERGRRLYGRICATCHGASGRGDGPSAPGMDPPPTAFDDSRMNLVSPHQLYGAVRFGIEGTAMPSYEGILDRERIWDISFFLMTLRSGFAPQPPKQELPLTLAALAQRSNEDLLGLVRDSGVDVDPAHIDHYRRLPESVHHSGPQRERVAEPAPSSSGTARAPSPAHGDLRVALQLQDAFAAVAEEGAASVVGVTGFVRHAEGQPRAPRSGGNWREGSPEERLYPGFRRARSGSGFLVSDDGYLLTAGHLLVDDATGKMVDVVDIELHQGAHRMARIVGTEPTIDLGVLQLEEFDRTGLPELRPVKIGDSDAVRVGHWAIALGNPAGPGTTFAVGTFSSRPERQCYQEDRSATLLQASLGVPAGGYGGPLMNIEGSVVGMVIPGPGADLSALVTPSRPLDFALPIDLAIAIYEPLKIKESRRSPWLGFSVLELRTARRQASPSGGVELPPTGVYVDDVFEPSPAAAADIRIGDVLISIDGNRLTSVGAFQKWLYLSGIGRTIALGIVRGGKTIEKRVTVEERPEAAAPR